MNYTKLPYATDHLHNLDVLVLVLWLGCVGIGIVGLICPYAHPQPLKLTPATQVETLRVELTRTVDQTPPPMTEMPKLPEPMPVPEVPQPMTVAAPSPAIAFAMPVARPIHLERKTSAVSPTDLAVHTPVAPAPQKLTFGEGAGQQPAPDYPAHARREGQEGDVTVRFTVNPDGQVTTAAVVVPSPWFLLNNAALNTIQTRWHFPSGPVRIYDVAIHFELTQ